MTARTPMVSVLMTSYNRERYIADAIESVLAQHFEDFELLVVDNCSTDGTVAVAREYERRDTRVRVVVNERNLGQFGNRNRAAELARGEFLKYADSDDLLYPHCLSVMVPPMLAERRAGIGLSMSRDFLGGPCPMLHSPRASYQRHFLGANEIFHSGPPCWIYRRDVFRRLGGYLDRGVISDVLFNMRACAHVWMLALPGDLFWYRRHPAQLLQSAGAATAYAALPGEFLRALNAPECPLTPDERQQARRNVAARVARQAAEHVLRGEWGMARRLLASAGLRSGEWLRLLRRPARDLDAGSPRSESGSYVTPNWSMFRVPDAAVLAETAGEAPVVWQ